MSRLAAQETKQIPVEEWENWCDLFTTDNAGRRISIELVGGVEGAQPLTEEIVLVAIDYDPAGKGDDMVISYGEEESPYHHIVNKPVKLWEGLDARGRTVALEIEDAAGNHAIVQFD